MRNVAAGGILLIFLTAAAAYDPKAQAILWVAGSMGAALLLAWRLLPPWRTRVDV